MKRLFAIVLCLLATACPPDLDLDGTVRVHVIGDSRGVVSVPPWPEHLPVVLPDIEGVPVEVTNHATGGATACDPTVPWHWGQPQLDDVLAATEAADVLIIQFGTNDLWFNETPTLPDLTPEDVTACILSLYGQAEAAGIETYVVSVTPHFPPSNRIPYNDEVAELNALLALTIPAERLLDFVSGFKAKHSYDGLHPNQSGHALLVERVADALKAWPN